MVSEAGTRARTSVLGKLTEARGIGCGGTTGGTAGGGCETTGANCSCATDGADSTLAGDTDAHGGPDCSGRGGCTMLDVVAGLVHRPSGDGDLDVPSATDGGAAVVAGGPLPDSQGLAEVVSTPPKGASPGGSTSARKKAAVKTPKCFDHPIIASATCMPIPLPHCAASGGATAAATRGVSELSHTVAEAAPKGGSVTDVAQSFSGAASASPSLRLSPICT